ncbi:MAG: hypothetical protein WDZ59_00610 [Pirellulales bacterium]
MNFQQLVLLLPCHSLEDFPTHFQGRQADGLLAAWTALWHPRLVAHTGGMLAWNRADDPPPSLPSRLVVIPEVSEVELPAGYANRIAQEGAVVLQNLHDRPSLAAAALEHLDDVSTPAVSTPLDGALIEDFYALGFCYLQVELLTRQMRYASNVDELHFQNELVAAAKAAVEGHHELARQGLGRCFDLLLEARDHFYPVDAFLIDLTLVAETTLGESLRASLAAEGPKNLLISGELVETMAQREPATLTALREALQASQASLVGGEYAEEELSLSTSEAMLRQLQRGSEVCERHLGKPVRVFGRRRYGLSPMLPQILQKLGYKGALHVSFDGGAMPHAEQAKTRWEGCDGSAIDALARMPLDASDPTTFLGYARSMGESMDRDHVATLLLAHWPGTESIWYRDLVRTFAYGPILGKRITLDDYFDTTDTPYLLSRFDADQYRPVYLGRAVASGESDPLSRPARDLAEQTRAMNAGAAKLLAAVVGTAPSSTEAKPDNAPPSEVNRSVAQAICGPSNGANGPRGALVLNTYSHASRRLVELQSGAALPAVSDAVRHVGRAGDVVQALVDTPGMGFTWIGPAAGEADTSAPAVPLAEENVLRNEYFEITIHPTTGAVQNVRDYKRRGNQFSQRLALRHATATRRSPSDAQAEYSVMAADSVEVTASTPVVGEITSRGRLLDRHGNVLADFQQRTRVLRGSRIAQLDIRIDPKAPPSGDPWRTHYVARFAWPDETAELYRSVSMTTHETTARRIESPHFVEVRSGGHRMTILPGGLPLHRRSGPRELDTLLITAGETSREFSLAFALDLTHSLPSALEMIWPGGAPVEELPQPASGKGGWFFHVSAKNVVVTHWAPWEEDGRLVGFRARLLETEGRAGRVAFRAPRGLASARQTDFIGQTLLDLAVSGDKISVDLGQYEWAEIEARWQTSGDPASPQP